MHFQLASACCSGRASGRGGLGPSPPRPDARPLQAGGQAGPRRGCAMLARRSWLPAAVRGAGHCSGSAGAFFQIPFSRPSPARPAGWRRAAATLGSMRVGTGSAVGSVTYLCYTHAPERCSATHPSPAPPQAFTPRRWAQAGTSSCQLPSAARGLLVSQQAPASMDPQQPSPAQTPQHPPASPAAPAPRAAPPSGLPAGAAAARAPAAGRAQGRRGRRPCQSAGCHGAHAPSGPRATRPPASPAPTHLAGHARPGPLVERAARGLHPPVHVRCVRLGHLRGGTRELVGWLVGWWVGWGELVWGGRHSWGVGAVALK
jgi:hypothetical protein